MPKRKPVTRWHTFRKAISTAAERKSFHHAHNLAYCVYYGIALVEDRGFKLIVVSVLFLAAVLSTLTIHNGE